MFFEKNKKKILLSILIAIIVAVVAYVSYYIVHYLCYNVYREYLSDYEYEEGTAFAAAADSENPLADLGYELVCENDKLKLYTDTSNCYIAVYDKRDGSITYTNPPEPDITGLVNKANMNFLQSQFLVYYYNSEVKSGSYNSYADSVYKHQFSFEKIESGIRYVYRVGDLKNTDGTDAISFEIPLEYRIKDDHLDVSVPVKGIKEYGNGYVYRIQLLRYMGASSINEDGYMVVPNGSGSIINFNNGKVNAPQYAQYIYDIDPLVSSYTTTENVNSARLPIFGICRDNRSLLVSVEDGETLASITACISGTYTDYNYIYPSFTLRAADNLRMFGDSDADVFVMDPDLADCNCTVRYTFLNEDHKGYAGLASYYRERLINEGILKAKDSENDIPFYMDVITGLKKQSHMLGVAYMNVTNVTTFDEAAQMSDYFADNDITNQVLNLQGWFNGGYYHDAPHNIRVIGQLGGKKGLKKLNETIKNNGGKMYADVAFAKVTFDDDGFNYNAESSRYYGAGYAVSFGRISPTTLSNNASLGYGETRYNLLSPRFLPRYVGKFIKKVSNIDVDGICLRDLGNTVTSDKKRTNFINREEGLDVVKHELEMLDDTGLGMCLNNANKYAFFMADDIINVYTEDTDYLLVDESIPLYEMVIHGCIDYGGELFNYVDGYHETDSVLKLIESGASPHFVFTMDESSTMKNTGLNNFYSTTFDVHKDDAVRVYDEVNGALRSVSGAFITDHEIYGNVRVVTYSNGEKIYINYGNSEESIDGLTLAPKSYRKGEK